MTADQALDVLRRAAAGETFDSGVIAQALRMQLPAENGPVPTPPGCRWDRPAPGWLDLKRSVQ